MHGCQFCRIIAGQAPARIVYQDEHVIAFHDRAPRGPVHVLLAPVEHIDALGPKVPAELLGHLMLVATYLANKTGIDATGYRVHCNVGRDGRQTIPHMHIHLTGGKRLPFL